MTGIILTMASAGVMCVAGVGVSSMFKWFHSYEMNMSKKPSGEVHESHPHADRLNALNKKIRG